MEDFQLWVSANKEARSFYSSAFIFGRDLSYISVLRTCTRMYIRTQHLEGAGFVFSPYPYTIICTK